MITLTVDDKEFKIVNSYEELSLGQYIDIINIGESKVKQDAIEADMSVICALSDNAEELKELLWSFDTDEFDELRSAFDWVRDDIYILESFKQLPPKESIEIEGKKYGIISNHNKLSLGEVVSYETLISQEQSDFHRLEIAFGILLRPIGDDGKLIKFTEDIFLEVVKNKYKINMMEIYSTIGFFLSGAKISTKGTTKRFSIQTK